MKTIKYFIAIILFSNLFLACTPDDTVEAALSNNSVEVLASGENSGADTDDEKDG